MWSGFNFTKEATNSRGNFSASFPYRAFAWVLIACNALQGCLDLKPSFCYSATVSGLKTGSKRTSSRRTVDGAVKCAHEKEQVGRIECGISD